MNEEQLKEIFVELLNSMINNKEEIIDNLTRIIEELTDTSKLDKKIREAQQSACLVSERIREWVNENAHRAMNQTEYEIEYQKRADEYRKIQESIEAMTNEKLQRQNKYKETVVVLNILKESEKPISEFDEGLFQDYVEIKKFA